MTISSTTRKAGPFPGNDVATQFGFAFKVFKKQDITVTLTDAQGVESVLTLDSAYSVALNANQDTNPGGTVTYPISGSPLPASKKLTISGALVETQPTDITNGGGFFPQVIEDALDRVTILVQQLREVFGRTIKFPISDPALNSTLPTAAQRANKLLSFDATGAPTTVAFSDQSATALQTALAASGGAGMVGVVQSGAGAVARTVRDKALEIPSLGDYISLVAAIAANYNGVLRIKAGTYNLPVSPVLITSPIVIECDGQGTVIFQKTAAVVGFKALASNVKFKRCQVLGNIVGDTTSGIQIGQNDGANGQSVPGGYINAPQCGLEDVLITACGNRGLDWQEGPFLELKNTHCFNAAQNNYYVSPNAFDASHGLWYTNSAGAGGDGYSINWGAHVFAHAKSYMDTGRGMYLDKSRGSVGNLFVELSGGACLQLGANTLANRLTLEFWTSGKNFIDGGIGNKVSGMSLGNNSGGFFDNYTRTNSLLVKKELVESGGTVLNGGLGISQTTNNSFSIGDPANAYACNLVASAAGLSLQGAAVHNKVFDLTTFGAINDLNAGNVHINVWLLSTGQTLRLNGAGGAAYTPFDGQTVTVYLKGAGTASIYGLIAGTLTTDTIVAANDCRTYMWQAAQGYWFVKK